MKKIITTALLSASILGFSQKADFGVKVGLNIANLNGYQDTFVDSKPIAGISAGVFAEFPLSETLAFQPEVLFSTQGGEYNFTKGEYSEKTNIKLNYVNVPLMFKYKQKGLNVEFGPQLGVAVLGSIRVEGNNGFTPTESTKVDMFKKENYSKKIGSRYDFGLNFGLSYDFTRNVFASARYTWGLTSIFDKGIHTDVFGDTAEAPKVKNSVFQIGVGIKF